MKHRISSLPMLVAVAVVALVLGSIGTAVAGPALTKGKVKSIATKVVKKQAPSLSVAHAATADTATTATTATKATTADTATKATTADTATTATNATTAANAIKLSGQTAAAYQNPSRTFALPQQAVATTRLYTLNGVTAGTYLVSYSVFLQGSGAFTSQCYLLNGPSGQQLGSSYGANYSSFNTNAATVVITVGATLPKLYCEGTVTWQVISPSGYDSRVTFTRIDASTAGAVSSAPASGTVAPTTPR